MKIIKDIKTSLLLKSFILNNQDYLSISILYYFDFNNPEAPLEEQKMYKELKDHLGKVMLDYAMPKQKAEVLACGNCYNNMLNDGASHVKLKVGNDIEKELYVFGERKWNGGFITKPKPFKIMPLDYSHAIGSDDFLPNVEDPKNLITSKNYKTEPASFLPIDITRQENMKKLGTHDEKWKREQWPGFATDMDYTFFNVASSGQIQDEFFSGGESIELLNMHPQKHLLTSHIPQTTFRCFATILHEEQEYEFKEIKLQRDTLWLFPDMQRGIVIFRGTLKIADEIYSDVKYLNIKPIFQDDELKTLDEYYEIQKKELNKSVELDEAPFEEADKKIVEAKKEIFDIPRQIKEVVQKTQGKRPSLRKTTIEKAQQSSARIDKAIVRMNSAKIKLQELKDAFGHITKVDVNVFDEAIADLISSKEKIVATLNTADKVVKNTKQMKIDSLASIKTIKNNPKIPPDVKEKIVFDFLMEKEKVWSDYAFDFLCECVKTLEKEPQELHKLRHLGLAQRTIPRAWIGFNSQRKILKAQEWKLRDENDIELPKGLVLARFEETTLKSLRIEDTIILGSDKDYELFLSEGNSNFPLFYFRDDIEAYLCDQEAFDICNSLVCNDILNVGDKVKKSLEEASVVFYLQEDGIIERLPNSKKFDCSKYKNLFELHQNGVEIRDQIIQNLPQDIKDSLPIERDISVKTIREKSKKITDKVKFDLKAKAQKLKKDIEIERDKSLAEVNKHLMEKGIDPIDMPKKVESSGFIKVSDIENVFNKAIDALKKRDGKDGINLKEKISDVQRAKEKLVILGKKGEVMYIDGLKKIAQAKEKVKNPIPPWAKEMMKKAGVDSENNTSSLTREKVVELHSKGISFAMKILSNLDLSGLNLSGIDLNMAVCKKTNFSNTNLSNAKLEQVSFEEVNLTQANLSNAKISMSGFKKAILNKTVFDDSTLDMALFDSTVLKECTFVNATFDGTIFKEMVVENATFENCHFINVTFIKSSIKDSSFNNSKIEGLLLNESDMNTCDLLYLDASKMFFNKSYINSCNFSRARLYNTRIMKSSRLLNCNFSYSDMGRTSIFEAILEKCNLKHAKLNRSLIRKSEINYSNFRGVIAKQGRFEYSTFEECSLVGINLFRGSLRRMDLKICDFSRSNLYAVEMYKTKLYEVKFNGANLKRSSLEGRVDLIGKEYD